MKRSKISTNWYLIIGLILFPIAFLILVRQPTFMSLISQLMPSTSTTDLFGVILLFLGEGAIAFGIIGQVASRVVASAEQDRLIYANAISRAMDQQASISTALLNVQDQISVISTQNQRSPALINCRFCGATMAEGRFCPSCRRAQN